MDLKFELASLSDTEATQCLNRVLSGVKESRLDIPITSSDDLATILRSVAAAVGVKQVMPKVDANLQESARAVRIILLELLGDPELEARLEAALAADRRVLVDPITSALVMAGIVLVLSTRFNIKYKRGKVGRSEFEVSVTKKPSSEILIKKFLELF
jgi:hypothetical protein